MRQVWTLQEILDEAAIDEETNQQATEMEKKISHEEKMLNALKKTFLQNQVVDVGVNTRKNARHSAPLAPRVENEIIMQTSAKVTLKERKAIAHGKIKLTT